MGVGKATRLFDAFLKKTRYTKPILLSDTKRTLSTEKVLR
ncbi:MAG: hypothetical protein ACLUSP_03770 [Christensenellales bacterium]